MLQTLRPQNGVSFQELVSVHEDVMRRGGAALEGGKMDAYLDLHVDNPVFHVFGPTEISGDFHGKAALRQLFDKIEQHVSGIDFNICIHDTLYTAAHGIWLILLFPNGQQAYEEHSTMYVVCHFYKGLISEAWFTYWPKKVMISPLPPSGHE